MATTLHRYSVSETPELAHAIDIVLVTYDELQNNRSAALRRIIDEGSKAIEREREKRIAKRRAAILEHAGSLTDVYPADAAARLKDEWPE
ncbi:hypothetical protein [Frondihabitans australicus]|uniref:Uncharacterized protein n=1 Tax=Frondihabitans australicus TaxID=386892 RepID=A0A495IMC5_9MICO|nr:hypothetical protein [Frondihabitans australicus]RKR76578.1 hypothetical protein C8E83_3755 [Frondihabitans australicus]